MKLISSFLTSAWPGSYYSNLRDTYYNYYLRRRYRYKRGTSPGTTVGLDLKTPLYLGGLDPAKRFPSSLSVRQGFTGCIAVVKVNMRKMNLITEALETLNVRDCGERDICKRRPCANNGVCERVSSSDYRYVVLGTNIEVNRDGFVEFNSSVFTRNQGQDKEIIKLTIKTTSRSGLLFWRGQSSPGQPIQSGDYLSIGLQDGFAVYSYELGTGPANLMSKQRINDGYAHNITALRLGNVGSLIIDDNYLNAMNGSSAGDLHVLNTKGNIYIGGVPLVGSMTGRKYSENFSGCISNIYLQDKGPLRVPEDAIGGFNVRPCLNRK
ncbi:hypothetical protein FSP39_002426 [Pinctada imbricata]|uniref:Laminin G domain-containing protein n=1 Tax=Pinctada imbricata TaxID=66713 RepID=A0AA88YQC1_PINIB|nr:hypothetical protein FSP39_002426 [Pinctada imbricata]